jgi:prophage regulatory protein
MHMINESNTSILRLENVKTRTGLSRSTIYALIKEKRFPGNISLGARSVGWLESEIQAWIESRVQASRNRQ